MKKRPEKPYKSFPLFPHHNGQWAKKVRGKAYYFGVWANPQAALKLWLSVKDELTAGVQPVVWDSDALTLAECLNLALAAKKRRRDGQELSERCWDDYFAAAKMVTECLDRDRPVKLLRPHDFQQLRDHLATGRSVITLRNLIRRVRVLFNWCHKNGYIDDPRKLWGTEFDLPNARALRLQKLATCRLLRPDRVRRLIDDSQGDLRAMILLGINCGYGPHDCGSLRWDDICAEGWANLARNKTGKTRRAKLWPETITALGERGEGLIFRTRYGNPWSSSSIAHEFRHLKDDRENIGFYFLRHTFLTVAEETQDFEAARAIMGHVDASITGQYRALVSDDRIGRVCEHVRKWLREACAKGLRSSM